MGLPIVAIVGRPNVGKSSLLNALARRRISIVDPMAGVTRDRVATVVAVGETFFELIDTGGYGIEDPDGLTEHIENQIRLAVRSAQLILFVVDVRDGVTALDQRVGELLRAERREAILVANKADVESHEAGAADFFRLGFGEAVAVSALHGRGRDELLERIAAALGANPEAAPAEPVMKIAVVGKRNAGKSTLINALAQEERVIVSETPGTTRDSIDVTFEVDGRKVLAIDTAGVKKKTKFANDTEFYAFARAERSIRRADVVLMMIDATVDLGQVDKKLAHFIVEKNKACVLVINKWDLAKERATTEAYGEYLTKTLRELSYAPIAFMTARDGKNVKSTLDVASGLFRQSQTRVSTAEINKALQEILALRWPTSKRGTRQARVYYGTQIAVCPPTLVLFVNSPGLFGEDYRRFLLNRLRERLPFGEVPIRLLLRARRPGRAQREAPEVH